jgi:hypothetical protein
MLCVEHHSEEVSVLKEDCVWCEEKLVRKQALKLIGRLATIEVFLKHEMKKAKNLANVANDPDEEVSWNHTYLAHKNTLDKFFP